jgi:hypothetical protein
MGLSGFASGDDIEGEEPPIDDIECRLGVWITVQRIPGLNHGTA